MDRRQGNGENPPGGRVAQRRRTRAAIVDAATRLLLAGRTPSIDEVAVEADVSRRTVYMYFPTLDQLLLDAAAGALSEQRIDAALAEAASGEDAAARVDALASAFTQLAPETLQLGRKIIRLTVDAEAAAPEGARRGYRRVQWIEQAVEPLRGRLSDEQFERLVSSLALVIGWEAQIVLRDVRGLDADGEQRVVAWAARALVQAMLAEADPD